MYCPADWQRIVTQRTCCMRERIAAFCGLYLIEIMTRPAVVAILPA
jgi:hypothetical protein